MWKCFIFRKASDGRFGVAFPATSNWILLATASQMTFIKRWENCRKIKLDMMVVKMKPSVCCLLSRYRFYVQEQWLVEAGPLTA